MAPLLTLVHRLLLLRALKQGHRPSYDVSPDGECFLMIKSVTAAEEEVDAPPAVLVQNWFEELKRRVRAD